MFPSAVVDVVAYFLVTKEPASRTLWWILDGLIPADTRWYSVSSLLTTAFFTFCVISSLPPVCTTRLIRSSGQWRGVEPVLHHSNQKSPTKQTRLIS